jgi:hypothetical protein
MCRAAWFSIGDTRTKALIEPSVAILKATIGNTRIK